MFETVTVDEALSRGKKMVNYPVLVILFGCILLPFILIAIFGLPGWVGVLGFLPGFAFAWLYWSIIIPRWRIWAFDNVRNVHELKKRAVKEKLIWADDSFFNKTEIWSAGQREQWANLQGKFKREDVFNDDYSIPAETMIYYSKVQAGGLMSIGVAMMGGAGYFYYDNNGLVLILIMLGIGLILGIMGYRHLSNTDPQITLNNDGVNTAGGRFCTWDMVSNEDTIVVRHGKSSTTYFRFIGPAGEVKVELSELAIRKSYFEKLLRIYRGRYQQKHPHGVWMPEADDQSIINT